MSIYKNIKLRTFEIIQTARQGDVISKIFDIFIVSLIIINLAMVIIETFKISSFLQNLLGYMETVSVMIFTIEYILRIWTADLLYNDLPASKARLKYILSFMALIDLFAILPFYLPFIIPIDLRVLRTIRVIRLLRIFKINRYTQALQIIGRVLKNKANQLISSLLVVGLLILIAAVLMYNIESTAQPDKFSNAFETMWWAIATLTTVGYGDIYPITAAGKVLSTIIAFLGIGLVAVPTGIITAGFTEIIEEDKKSENDDKKHFCPYCGHKIDE